VIAVIPPYPYYVGDRQRFDVLDELRDPDSVWFVRPQLFFNCSFRPRGAASAPHHRSTRGPDDIDCSLVFFSIFDDLQLRTKGVMEDSGVRRLYEPSPIPSLYVGLLSDILGRAPLAPCFLDGNSTPTIPACFARQRQSAFPFGQADTDSSQGSNVYEVNIWLWQFGRGRPRIGGRDVAETEKRREARMKARQGRAWETRKRRKEAREADAGEK
jgi:hypothetical protein